MLNWLHSDSCSLEQRQVWGTPFDLGQVSLNVLRRRRRKHPRKTLLSSWPNKALMRQIKQDCETVTMAPENVRQQKTWALQSPCQKHTHTLPSNTHTHTQSVSQSLSHFLTPSLFLSGFSLCSSFYDYCVPVGNLTHNLSILFIWTISDDKDFARLLCVCVVCVCQHVLVELHGFITEGRKSDSHYSQRPKHKNTHTGWTQKPFC